MNKSNELNKSWFYTAVERRWILVIIVSWIFVGFLSWLFLLLSTLRKSEYNKEDLKDYFNVRDLLCICLCGWFSPVIIFVIILLCYIADKFESRKCSFREWLYDILYKIANVGVNQKENKKKED